MRECSQEAALFVEPRELRYGSPPFFVHSAEGTAKIPIQKLTG